MIVKQELEKLGLHCLSVDLGTVEIKKEITDSQKEQFRKNLQVYGLELLDNRRNIIIEKVKAVIIEMIHYSEEQPKVNYSDYISDKLGYNYTYLANTFSEVKGITIQRYIIINKIERVKELLMYDELNLTEISYKLHYSSVAHLSNQFKRITGLTPTHFKKMKEKRLKHIEDL